MGIKYFLSSLLLIIASSVSAAQKDVLVVHSYHPGFFWNQSLVEGLETATEGKDIAFQHAYLESKRYQSEAYREQLKKLYIHKLTNHNFDAILTTDNAALWLIHELHDYIGDTPVVYAGLNNFGRQHYPLLPQLTGVKEEVDLPRNLALMKQLHPDLERVYLLLDNTFSSRQYWNVVQAQLARGGDSGLDIVRISSLSFSALQDRIQAMHDGEAVFYLSYFRDANGQFLDRLSGISTLTQHAPVPIYGAMSFMLGQGVVGGIVIDGKTQGQYQGKLLLEVLDGKLPAERESTNRTMFDYLAIQRWALDVSALDDAVIINTPQPIWQAHPVAVQAVALAVLVLGSVIVMLGANIRQLRRSESSLMRHRAMLKGVFDQSNQFIALLDQNGILVSGNASFKQLVTVSPAYRRRPVWLWPIWRTPARLEEHLKLTETTQPHRFELCLSEAHREVILDVAVKSFPSESGQQQVLFEARDITQRKQTEEKLQRSEIEYRMLYEQQPVILLTIDYQARIQSLNQYAADLFGYDKSALLGHKITTLYADHQVPPHRMIKRGNNNQEQVWRREIPYRAGNGHTLWVRETIRAMHNQTQLLVVGEDITAHREMESQLTYQAHHDYLTGLYNRSYFEQKLAAALLQAREEDQCHAMYYIDMDQFKLINDTAGHEAGDEALKQVAQIIQQHLPKGSVLSRLGGDEFGVIAYHHPAEQAVTWGHKLLSTLADSEFFWHGSRMRLACSLGIRLLDRTAGSPQQVHAQADTACYAAKDEGRNRLHLYHPDDEELQRREQEMAYVSHIHDAIAHDRFDIYAQQIVDIRPGSQDTLYIEALVRMRDTQGGWLPPSMFIPAAERYNMAHQLDTVVVTKTLAWFDAHPEQIAKLGKISINLSGRSITQKDFVTFLIAAIEQTQVPSECICLEITETAAITNMSSAIELFSQLKALGCVIALDDFGAGISSFGYLKRLPVDIIKIDGQFIRDIATDDTDYAMVKAINDLAKQMGKQTVAEFVENAHILNKLRALDVDYAQGYHFSVPAPLGEQVKNWSARRETMKEKIHL
ncbi:ABC transporter substrate binding protein [Salinivibrio sp. ES.052]|uniref:ABC transporter substrate binding protein n=1 Tax=Salinivibrio sp. ES.052 TaxID=1882823 RepID=UPI00092BFCA8|nr:ABC transporter substrate binding protein [Salinivibrio sp. ES.052]SIO21361.1 diguanylate cyclase/phosphodiesterase /diguanylate cyclase/phosphodiesterase with PAS/PAC sensor(s) [Salinivibrio sp. ES.052]